MAERSPPFIPLFMAWHCSSVSAATIVVRACFSFARVHFWFPFLGTWEVPCVLPPFAGFLQSRGSGSRFRPFLRLIWNFPFVGLFWPKNFFGGRPFTAGRFSLSYSSTLRYFFVRESMLSFKALYIYIIFLQAARGGIGQPDFTD